MRVPLVLLASFALAAPAHAQDGQDGADGQDGSSTGQDGQAGQGAPGTSKDGTSTSSNGTSTSPPPAPGSGQPTPSPPQALALSRTSLGFGRARYRRATKALTVVVTNVGAGSTHPLRPRIAAGRTTDFAITAATCANRILAPGESCSISVVAKPQGRRERRATLQVGDRSVTLAVYGLRSKRVKRVR